MSAVLYIVLQRKEPGLDAYVDGKALSRADAELTALAESLNVTPLMSFFSMNPEELLAEVEGLGADAPDSASPEQWFSAADGLVTVRTLLRHLDSNADAFPSRDEVASEFTGFAHVLEQAEQHGIGWHLAVDYTERRAIDRLWRRSHRGRRDHWRSACSGPKTFRMASFSSTTRSSRRKADGRGRVLP
jgi:hypothetical protein